MGDLNGRIGNHNTGIKEYLGKGEPTKSNNGDRIIEICIENELVIANMNFKHKDNHKYVSVEENRNEKSIVDYFLISKHKWKNIQEVKVMQQDKIGNVTTQLIVNNKLNSYCLTPNGRKAGLSKIILTENVNSEQRS